MDIVKKKLDLIVIILLSAIAISIYIPVIKEIISTSGHHDFQWSPTKIMLEKINHYQYMLDGNTKKILMSQYGEYLHGLYVILIPYGLMQWPLAKICWLITNILILTYLPIKLSQKFLLSKIETYLVLFFFSCCIVTKVQLITGQQTLLVLLFFSLPFIFNSKLSTFFSGICYFKYTIGYSLFFYFLILKDFKKLFLSVLPAFFGWIIYSILTKSNLFDTIFQPFQLAIENQIIGETVNDMPKNKFLFSILENIKFLDFEYKGLFLLIISLTLSVFLINKISKIKNDLQKLSCLTLISLIFLPHYPHDYVLLLPLLIYSIKNFNNLNSKISLIIIVYFLQFFKGFKNYMIKLMKLLNFDSISLNFVEYLISYSNILILLFLLLINLNNKVYFTKKIKN